MPKIKATKMKTISIELNEMQLEAVLFALQPAMNICDKSKKPDDLKFFPKNYEGFFFLALMEASDKMMNLHKQNFKQK